MVMENRFCAAIERAIEAVVRLKEIALARPSELFNPPSTQVLSWSESIDPEVLVRQAADGTGADWQWWQDVRGAVDEAVSAIASAAAVSGNAPAGVPMPDTSKLRFCIEGLELSIKNPYGHMGGMELPVNLAPLLAGAEYQATDLRSMVNDLRDLASTVLDGLRQAHAATNSASGTPGESAAKDSSTGERPRFVDRKEFAEILGVSVDSVERLEREGMPSVRVGQGKTAAVRIEVEVALKWLRARGQSEKNSAVRKPRRDGRR